MISYIAAFDLGVASTDMGKPLSKASEGDQFDFLRE